jgi:hypothetical protein
MTERASNCSVMQEIAIYSPAKRPGASTFSNYRARTKLRIRTVTSNTA